MTVCRGVEGERERENKDYVSGGYIRRAAERLTSKEARGKLSAPLQFEVPHVLSPRKGSFFRSSPKGGKPSWKAIRDEVSLPQERVLFCSGLQVVDGDPSTLQRGGFSQSTDSSFSRMKTPSRHLRTACKPEHLWLTGPLAIAITGIH